MTLKGVFRVAITTSSLAVDAYMITSVKIPGSSAPLFDLIGAANFGIDADGIYGRALLSLKPAGRPAHRRIPLGASAFPLEFNTRVDREGRPELPDRPEDRCTIGKTLQTISLPERTLHLASAEARIRDDPDPPRPRSS